MGAAVHLPRLPLRRGDRLAGRADHRRPRGRRRAHRHAAAPAPSPARTRTSKRLHENVVWGMRGNFVDVPTDCPQRDERLGWTGRPAGLRADGVVPLRHRRGCCGPGWPTSRSSSSRTTTGRADLRAVPRHQPPASRRCRPTPAGVTPPSSCRGRCTSGHGDARAAGRPVGQHDRLDRRVRAAGPARTWTSRTAASCSATGWTPRRRRTTPRPRGRRGSASPPPTSPGRRAWWRRRPRSSAATAARFADLAERAAARFRAEYVTPNGRVAFPSQTAYALALEFDLLRPEQREHAGRLLAEQVLKRRLPHRHRLPRDAVRHRRADRTPASWRRPTSCCCSGRTRRGSTR